MKNKEIQNNKMKISEVKGRPMLEWVGKKAITIDTDYPAQLVETYNSEAQDIGLDFKNLEKNWHNLLFHGDNKEVLINLLINGFRGKIDLIYIDPPFASGADYIREVKLRGNSNQEKLQGEEHNRLEQKQYFDIWKNDDYLQFMYERLILLKELLSEQGSIYLHCDWHKSHHLRCLLDEVFGAENFKNEIIWCYHGPGSPNQKQFTRKHDTIYWYSIAKKCLFNENNVLIPYHTTTADKFKSKGTGFTGIANLKSGKIPEDWWQLPVTSRIRTEITNYPTQKPEKLLERIIKASSKSDSIVFDCFCGSGTTQAVAQKLGRRWIGSDINKGAVQTTSKRIQKIIQAQKKTLENKNSSIAHFKVNDYDLQILHIEALELAVQKLGIEKTNDTFFDGIINGKLVRIIDIMRLLIKADLSDLEDELKNRKEEERDIILVCLGQEENTKELINTIQ